MLDDAKEHPFEGCLKDEELRWLFERRVDDSPEGCLLPDEDMLR